MSTFDTDKDGRTMHSSQNLILFKHILYAILLWHIERTKSMSIARTSFSYHNTSEMYLKIRVTYKNAVSGRCQTLNWHSNTSKHSTRCSLQHPNTTHYVSKNKYTIHSNRFSKTCVQCESCILEDCYIEVSKPWAPSILMRIVKPCTRVRIWSDSNKSYTKSCCLTLKGHSLWV